MSNWITVGRSADPALPPDRLTPAELAELHRLLAARDNLREQQMMLEHQLELLMLAARDRRGFSGKLRADPESGAIEPCAAAGAGGGEE